MDFSHVVRALSTAPFLISAGLTAGRAKHRQRKGFLLGLIKFEWEGGQLQHRGISDTRNLRPADFKKRETQTA